MAGQQKSSDKERTFPGRLRLRMARLNVQGNELAERLEVAPSAVSNWLSGANLAKGRNLRRLAEALDCDAAWLTGLAETGEPVVDGGGILREEPSGGEAAHWRERALRAERRLAALEGRLRALLGVTEGAHGAAGPAGVSSKGVSATGRAARKLLRSGPRAPASSESGH